MWGVCEPNQGGIANPYTADKNKITKSRIKIVFAVLGLLGILGVLMSGSALPTVNSGIRGANTVVPEPANDPAISAEIDGFRVKLEELTAKMNHDLTEKQNELDRAAQQLEKERSARQKELDDQRVQDAREVADAAAATARAVAAAAEAEAKAAEAASKAAIEQAKREQAEALLALEAEVEKRKQAAEEAIAAAAAVAQAQSAANTAAAAVPPPPAAANTGAGAPASPPAVPQQTGGQQTGGGGDPAPPPPQGRPQAEMSLPREFTQPVMEYDPPKTARFEDIQKWRDAVRETEERMRKFDLGGKPLQDMIHKEVVKLELKRHNLFAQVPYTTKEKEDEFVRLQELERRRREWEEERAMKLKRRDGMVRP